MVRWLGVLLTVALSAPSVAPSSVPAFHQPVISVGAGQSRNWSGYNQGTLEQGGRVFHEVSGSWVVPSAGQRAAGEAEYSATWVGIGGGCADAACTVDDRTLIQAGTEQDVDRAGRATYSAWWETIPAPSVTTRLPVAPGDRVQVDIREGLPAVWTIAIQNLSRRRSFTATVPYTSTHGTAEWIEEAPVALDLGGSLTPGPLPDLSTVGFDLAATNGAGAGLRTGEQVQLVDSSGRVQATPSAPDVDRDGFNVCAYATSCHPPESS